MVRRFCHCWPGPFADHRPRFASIAGSRGDKVVLIAGARRRVSGHQTISGLRL